jgi:hypothetical protein
MKQVSVSKMVVHRGDEGKPVFAVLADGSLVRVGWTTSGPRTFAVPDEATAVVWVLYNRRDGALFIAEASDGLPVRGTLSTWRQSADANRAQMAADLDVSEDSPAVAELMKLMYRFVK